MDVMQVLSTRRTFRAFTQEPVPADVLADILEAGPCRKLRREPAEPALCGGAEAGGRGEAVRADEVGRRYPGRSRDARAGSAPPLFVVILQDVTVPGYSDVDVGIAATGMATAAWAKGVGSCMIGTLNRAKTAEFLGLPENLQVHTGIAFGYPAHKSTVVPLKDGRKNYWRDENGDYYVPKYALEEIVRYL